ncbi:hypothetical protein KCU88_g730, partial [Aureobasidium melanogenum]
MTTPSDPAKVMVIRDITPNITTLSVPFARFGLIKVGGRATLVKLQTGNVAVFSPVALTSDVKSKVRTMGPIKYIVAPDIEHHIFVTPWAKEYPEAEVVGVEGLPEKREGNPDTKGIRFHHIFTAKNKRDMRISPEFDDEFDYEYFHSHSNKELVFLHKPSRTLIEADMLFNLPATEQYSKAAEDPRSVRQSSLVLISFSNLNFPHHLTAYSSHHATRPLPEIIPLFTLNSSSLKASQIFKMPVISRILSIALRIGQLAFAAVVAGIVGSYLHGYRHGSGLPLARFIYIEIVAGISILLALLWLLPFSAGFNHWPVDLLLSFAWFAAFALLVNYVDRTSCGGHTFNWGGITRGGVCNRWKANEAFSFLSAIFWMLSALLGLWYIHRESRKAARGTAHGDPTAPVAADDAAYPRRRWYRRSRV